MARQVIEGRRDFCRAIRCPRDSSYALFVNFVNYKECLPYCCGAYDKSYAGIRCLYLTFDGLVEDSTMNNYRDNIQILSALIKCGLNK